MFDIQKIEMYTKQTNKLSNIYLYYILMKICIKFRLNILIDIINRINYGIINIHIKTKTRECKFIYSGNLYEFINFMKKNDKQLKHQINLPNKYLISECNINNYKDIHHLLYLYYDPEKICLDNTIINILNVNQLKYNIDDTINFKLFKGRPYIINKKLSELIDTHVNIINELI